MGSERLFGLASVAVLITAIFSLVMVEGQEVEGSGSLDDDEDGLDVPSRPTRIVEEQTPTLDIFPTKTANKPSISVDREIDPIYVSLSLHTPYCVPLAEGFVANLSGVARS